MENRTQVSKEIEQGLNSPELKRSSDIPYADEVIELNLVKPNEPKRPKRSKDETADREPLLPEKDGISKIHASDLGDVHSSPNNDTIVVNTPEGTLYITLEPDSGKSSSPLSPATQSTDLDATPSTSKSFGASESDELIRQEIASIEQRKASLRRNSISMPTLQNLELEVMKQQFLNTDGVSNVLFSIWHI